MRKNNIELKPSDFCNIELNEIYVNNKFYTAIIGINFADKRGKYTKYQFIHDNLHAIIEPDECAIRLFNRLSFELIELDSKELDKLLYQSNAKMSRTKQYSVSVIEQGHQYFVDSNNNICTDGRSHFINDKDTAQKVYAKEDIPVIITGNNSVQLLEYIDNHNWEVLAEK